MQLFVADYGHWAGESESQCRERPKRRPDGLHRSAAHVPATYSLPACKSSAGGSYVFSQLFVWRSLLSFLSCSTRSHDSEPMRRDSHPVGQMAADAAVRGV